MRGTPISKTDIQYRHECGTCFKQCDESSNTLDSSLELEPLASETKKSCCDKDRDKTIIVYPKIVKIADKDVETGRCKPNKEENYCDDNEELRRQAYKMYRQYLASKSQENKCPPYVYAEPRKRQFGRCGAFVGDDGGIDYDPSCNIFLAIVFMILFVMLLFTTGFIYVVLNTDWLKESFLDLSLYLSLPALGLLLAMNYAMACSECTRMPPCNFVCLLLAVSSMSIIAAVVSVIFDTTVILLIYSATAAVVFFCILLAYSHFDFTKWFLYVIAILVTLFAIAVFIMSFKKLMDVHYGAIQIFIIIVCTIVNVVIFVIELQMILGGRTVELDEGDYALGAFLLYTAVIEIFLSLVQVTGLLEEID